MTDHQPGEVIVTRPDDRHWEAEIIAAKSHAAKLGVFDLTRASMLSRVRAAIARWLARLAELVAPTPRPCGMPSPVDALFWTVELEGGPAHGTRWIRKVTDTEFGVNAHGGVDSKASGGSYHIARRAKPGMAVFTWRPPASSWPSGMGAGLRAAAEWRKGELTRTSRFVRVAYAQMSSGIEARLEGQSFPGAPWRTIAPLDSVNPSRGEFKIDLRIPPAPGGEPLTLHDAPLEIIVAKGDP